MAIDYSALNDPHERLSFGWRDVSLEDNVLSYAFPSRQYHIDPERSVVKDGVWYLHVEKIVDATVAFAQMINVERYQVPSGVERIVIGEVEEMLASD